MTLAQVIRLESLVACGRLGSLEEWPASRCSAILLQVTSTRSPGSLSTAG